MANSIMIEGIGGREDLKAVLAEVIREHFETAKQERYFSREEIRDKYGVCYPTVDKAIANGELDAVRIGGRILIKETGVNFPKATRKHYKPRK